MNHIHSTKQAQPQSFVAFLIKESLHEFSKPWKLSN